MYRFVSQQILLFVPAEVLLYTKLNIRQGWARVAPRSHLPPIIQISSASNATAPSPNLQTILTDAFAKYTKKTGKDLLTERLATRIRDCSSSDEIRGVFQEQAQAFQQFRNGDSKLFKWLKPIVYVLNAFAPTLSAGVGHVSPTKLVIFISP